jgi:hypothetical protein
MVRASHRRIALRTVLLGVRLALLVALPLLAGCGAQPAGSGIGGTIATRGASAASAAPAATTMMAPTPVPRSPTIAPAAFWAGLFNGEPEAVTYSSLAEMVKDSDLVVLGSFAGVTAGPDSDAGSGETNYMATVTVKVTKVLRGTVSASTDETVPVVFLLGTGRTGNESPYTTFIANLKASMPAERGVFFLQNLVAYYSRFDPTAKSRYDPTVYQVTSVQGLFRDTAGKVDMPATATGAWIATYKGKSFDTVVSQLASACAAAAN